MTFFFYKFWKKTFLGGGLDSPLAVQPACACFYCPYLWTHDKKFNHSKLRVAFNNVYRHISKLPPRQSIVLIVPMYAMNHIDSLEVLVRKRVAGIIERLKDSKNLISFCIDNTSKIKFDIWADQIKK